MADEPIRTASHCVFVIGDEADPLNGYVLIEFVPIDRLGLDDQATEPLAVRQAMAQALAQQFARHRDGVAGIERAQIAAGRPRRRKSRGPPRFSASPRIG